MIQLLKKRRSQWFFESSQEFTEQEIQIRQEILSKQEQKNMEFWQKCKELKKRPNLFQTEKKIDLDQYQEKDFDEKDIIVIPIQNKKNQLIISLEDSPIRQEEDDDDNQLVIVDDINDFVDIEKDDKIPQFQIQKVSNANLQNLNLEKDHEVTSERMINDTFQMIKEINEESKVNEDINASHDTTVFSKTFVQQFINERKQAIIENQVAIEENINKPKETVEQENNDIQIEKQNEIQPINLEHQIQDISFNQHKPTVIVSSNNLNENQKTQKAIIIEEDKVNEDQNKMDEDCQEDKEQLVWLPLKAPQQIPISYFADWRFKGQDRVNIEFGKNYDASTLFRMLFTQPIYTLIIQNIYKKFNKKITKKNIYQDPIEINSYDIDAYISLLLHSQCLQHPNLINTINKVNSDMDHHILQFIQSNFSIGAKEQDEDGNTNEMAKTDQFIQMINQRLKQLVQPKEYLQLLHKTIEGNYFKSNSQYYLDEFRLYDFNHSFIVDIQFDKSTPDLKKSQDYIQKLMRVQANVLDSYKGKGHKVVIQNQLFDADILRSLRNQNIGVVTKSHIENIQFTSKQLKMISENKLFKNFFFIYEREVQAVITPYSFSHKYAFISNFLGLEDTKDLANPKMQQIYSEKGVVLDYKDINSRDVEGVKWDQLVFLRVLDVIVKNTHSLYQYINNDSKITKEQIIKDLKKQFLQSYQAHRELQHKICVEKISTSKDFRVHFWEEIQGGKKQECIVCHTKTKNYCIQCSEKKKQIIGFCGNSNCLQKHNELPAKLLNQQFSSVDVSKKKNQYDKPYESATESSGGFKSKLGFRPFDSNRDQSSFRSSSIRRLDGYQSEAVSSIKSKNFSNYQHDDGFKSDAGSSFNVFSHRKKNNESQTFKTIQQLAKEHDSQFNSSKNIRSFNHENSSLADEIINVYQKKKTVSSNNLDKNSQEAQLSTKDTFNQIRDDDKNQTSGNEKSCGPLKVRDFTQLRSKGSLSDIEGQTSHKTLDSKDKGEHKQINQEKKKRQSKIPWYNTEMEEEEDRRFKEQDRKNAQQIFQNPKVREILFESDTTQKSLANKLERNQKLASHQKQQEINSHSHKQPEVISKKTHNHQSKKQVFEFEQEDDLMNQEASQNTKKNQTLPELKTKKETPFTLQQSFGIQATPTLGDSHTASFSALNQSKDKNNLKENVLVEKKKYQFEEEEDDNALLIQDKIQAQQVKQLSQSQQSIQNSIQENQNNKILNNLDLETSIRINSQHSLSKKYDKDKNNSSVTDIQSNLSSETKGKMISSQQKLKSTSIERPENSLQGIIKLQKGTIQNMEEVQNGLQSIDKDNQSLRQIETSNNAQQGNKNDKANQEAKQKVRMIIKALNTSELTNK